jgi:hypothetical protein
LCRLDFSFFIIFIYNRSDPRKSRPFIWSHGVQKGLFYTIYERNENGGSCIKIALTDEFCIWDGTVVADTDTAPWVHYNDTSFVEMNFMVEGHTLQTHEGLLDQYHYRKGHHNILFNPYSMETNQLLSIPLQPAPARGVIQTGMPKRIQAKKIFQASVLAERICARSGRKAETG